MAIPELVALRRVVGKAARREVLPSVLAASCGHGTAPFSLKSTIYASMLTHPPHVLFEGPVFCSRVYY